MKLRHHLLLWFALVSVLPLVLLLFMANHYDRQQYFKELDQELRMELDRLVASIEQQISAHRDLVSSLARSPVIEEFGDALYEVSQYGSLTWRYSKARKNLEQLFVDLQPLIPERAVIRLLDANGNTVIKAQFVETSQPTLESLPPYPVYDIEPESSLTAQLRQMPVGEVSYFRYPGHNLSPEPIDRRAMLDMVMPVEKDGWRVYLVFSSLGERLDKLMSLTPRLRDGEITVLEYDPARTLAYQVLFSDRDDVAFSDTSYQDAEPLPELIAAYESQNSGVLETRHGQGRWYYQDYYPYSDQLISWIVGIRLDLDDLINRTRTTFYGLLGLGAFNLFLGLLLASFASRRLAEPIVRLADNMRDYASGKPPKEDMSSLSSEVGALQDSFRHMTETLEASQKEQAAAEKKLALSAKLASIGEMAAGIGHELNNPLTNILSLGKLVKRSRSLTPELAGDVDEMIDEARRASRIVRGILDFGRQGQLDLSRIELCAAMEQFLQRVERGVQDKHLNVALTCEPGLEITGDRFQLEQVMVNLLENAIFASPVGGRLELEVARQNHYARIRVIDEGEGIDPVIAERLYEPFFTTKKVGEGSGLGLSISLGIVEMHDGSLMLFNQEPKGCVAEVLLPLADKESSDG